MKIIKATHRTENDRTIVNLRFKTIDQLLDPDDPCPLRKKELTQEAEDAILNNVFAERLKKPVTLEIQVPGVPDSGSATEISDAIRHHFRSVLTDHQRDTAIFIRERRTALALTAFNIMLALFYLGYSFIHEDWMTTITGQFIGGVIIIMNWATIWDTYEFFIFDGREKSHRKKLLNKIINADIRIIPLLPEDAGNTIQ
jgi:hypothetical protein